ncbi:MAG TPA: tetratricopeptide repeat protein [Polyangiales bacterium]|nr:tetratricopeptide repeat protein [Polyangiales bacterium]
MSTKSRAPKSGKHHSSAPHTNMRSASERTALLQQAGQLQNAGDLPRAAAIYNRLLAVEPQNDRARFLLGLIEHQRGDNQTARAHFERLLKLPGAANDPIYRLWYARVLQAMGQVEQSLIEVRRSKELDPQEPAAYYTESLLLRDLGDHAQAQKVLIAAVAIAPQAALLHARLGETYLALGDYASARIALERAIELDGGLCAAWVNLGIVLQAEGLKAPAELAFEQAIRLEPNNGDAHFSFGAALENNDHIERAISHVLRAVELAPQRGEWQTALAGLVSQIAEFDEALSLYRSGLALKPNMREHSSLLALQQYLPGEAEERLPEARRWAALHVPGPSSPPPTRAPNSSSKLRIGYVSPDFREHSVSYFFEPLLAAHDLSRVAVTCYSNSTKSDDVTARLAQRANMRSIADLSDAQFAQLIRDDGIDVLVDLAGHTVGHRLCVFGQECAPLQLAYLGYPGTTGVPAIRWRLTDPLVDPAPLADTRYSERLYRLPRVFCCYQPPMAAPPVGPLPGLSRGQVTFGSLNKYMKVTDQVMQLWSNVLSNVPNSRLILQSRLFADQAGCERVRERFVRYGVAAERVELFGMMPLAEHLKLYQQIDIGLDTHPWNGHTTTCLALHMGVPVLALAGDAGASRMGVSVLSAAGLADWVAPDEAAYVAAAQRRASELGALSELRAGLRTQLQSSALCDGPSLAREVEDAFFALIDSQ